MKILIVEDDADARTILHTFLRAKGHEIVTASDGLEALQEFEREKPDLMLLDVMMPKLDGWDVLAGIRAQSDVPVLMVTAKDATEEVVRGFSSGVDDYIVKPFKLREVEARIEAVMRRYHPRSSHKLGGLQIDDRSKAVHLKGKKIALSPKEFALLQLLASHPGRVFSDREILRYVWPEGSLASANDVKRYVHMLRVKLEEDVKKPKRILTVRGFGYRLVS
ncbi:response regulator transcription factor [Candidatus Acetothermia bacterium]|nr:response regulator transcription factor [Candidatus Acetothermia bacterium]MBI3659257.1 response regulator transcription factor [Candidatus Acetothermia bacterium]